MRAHEPPRVRERQPQTVRLCKPAGIRSTHIRAQTQSYSQSHTHTLNMRTHTGCDEQGAKRVLGSIRPTRLSFNVQVTLLSFGLVVPV